MGNVNRNEHGDSIIWEYQRADGTWHKYDKDTIHYIESTWLAGNTKKFMYKDNHFDLVNMVEKRKDDQVRSIRRQILWNETQLQYFLNSPPPVNRSTYHDQILLPDESIGGTFSNIRNPEIEYSRLKQQNSELVMALKEAVEQRDIALTTTETAQEALKVKNQEIDKLRELTDNVEELKKELEGRREEVKSLGALNGELRLKLTSELQELGMRLRPNVEETEELKTQVHRLTMEVQYKEREIDHLKSAPVTPASSPRLNNPPSPSKSSKDGVSPKLTANPPGGGGGRPQHKLSTSSNTITPRSSRPAVPPLLVSNSSTTTGTMSPTTENLVSSTLMTRKTSNNNLGKRQVMTPPPNHQVPMHSPTYLSYGLPSTDPVPRTRTVEAGLKVQSDDSLKTGLTLPTLSGGNTVRVRYTRRDNQGRGGEEDLLRDSKKLVQEVEELKEKLSKAESRMKVVEGELEVERLKLSNLRRELNGRDKEIELIRQQKMKLKDEFNEQIQANEELNTKLQRKTEQLLKYEKKINKIKSKYANVQSQSEEEEEEESTSALQEDLSELMEKLSDAKSKCQHLKLDNNKLSEANRELTERLSQLEEQKLQLEAALAKLSSDLKEKEKDIQTMKNSQKDLYSSKIFKALAEEAQNEKAKALTLSQKSKTLTEELKEKDREIEQLKITIQSIKLKSVPIAEGEREQILEDLHTQLKHHQARNTILHQELLELRATVEERQKAEEVKTPQILISDEEDELGLLKKELEAVRQSIQEKDAQIEVLRNQKSDTNGQLPEKSFKALAEEVQQYNTKSLLLTKELTDLKAQLDQRDREISRLNNLLQSGVPQAET